MMRLMLNDEPLYITLLPFIRSTAQVLPFIGRAGRRGRLQRWAADDRDRLTVCAEEQARGKNKSMLSLPPRTLEPTAATLPDELHSVITTAYGTFAAE